MKDNLPANDINSSRHQIFVFLYNLNTQEEDISQQSTGLKIGGSTEYSHSHFVALCLLESL